MSKTWLRIEDGQPIIEDVAAMTRWIELADGDEMYIPAGHVEGHQGEYQLHVSELPADVDDDWKEAEL